MTDEVTEREPKPASRSLSLVLIAVLLIAAAGLTAVIFSTEPKAKRSGATKKTAMLVEVVEAEHGTYRPTITAMGTVEPARDVLLRPEVEGRVVELGEGFEPGGFIGKGELILRVQSADYRHELAQQKSALHQARAELALEEGRQDAAREEYEFLNEKLAPENEALVLRQPQLQAAKERVEAARAAVAQAELDVGRTRLKAPFDAHVLRRDVDIGSQVSPNDVIGRIVGIDTYWVAVELPLRQLRWVRIPRKEGQEGSPVRIRNEQSWPADVFRTGEVFRLVGALDANTRMARVIAAIPDPLARAADENVPQLMVGEFVKVQIEGLPLENVVRIRRDLVRAEDTVWVMREDGTLGVEEVDVLLRDAEYAYISSGLAPGARVIKTNLSTVVEGAPVRLEGSASAASREASPKTDARTND